MRTFTDKQVDKMLGELLAITKIAEKQVDIYTDPAIDDKAMVKQAKEIVRTVQTVVNTILEGEETQLKLEKR